MNLLLKLHNANQAATRHLAAHTAAVTPAQLFVLAAIAGAPNESQTAIVAATGIDRSTLADVVRRLTKAKLVYRVRDKKDKRAYRLTLTAAGNKALAAGREAAKSAEAALVADWPGVKAFAS